MPRKVTVLPMTSPSYALAGGAYLDTWESHLKLIPALLTPGGAGVEVVQSPSLRLESKSKAESTSKTESKDKTKTKGLDLETSNLKPYRGGILITGISDGATHQYTRVTRDTLEALKALYQNPVPEFVVHGAMMEAGWGWHHLGVPFNSMKADTMLLAKREDVDQPANLEDLAASRFPGKYAGYKLDTNQALEEGKAEFLPPAVLGKRCAIDAAACLDLFYHYEDKLGPAQMAAHYKYDVPIVKALAKMAHNGISVDVDHLRTLGTICATKGREAGEVLAEIIKGLDPALWDAFIPAIKDPKEKAAAERARSEFNPGSPDQIRAVLELCGLDTGEKTAKGGKMSTSRDAVLKLDHPIVNALIEYRRWQKIQGDFVDGLPGDVVAGVMEIDWFFPIATRRLSSSQPIQRIPRRDPAVGPLVRRLFRSRWANGLLAEFDLSQIELCIQASLSKDAVMLQMLREGRDLHTHTANEIRRILGLPPPEGAEAKRSRDSGKFANFACGYGAGDHRLMATARKDYGLFLSKREARAARDGRANAFPGYARWADDLRNSVMRGELVRCPMAELVRDPRLLLASASPHAVALSLANWPIQTAGAMLCHMGHVRALPELDKVGALVVGTIHDSLVVDFPSRDAFLAGAPRVLGAMRDVMAGEAWYLVPPKVDCKVGPNLADMVEWKEAA